MLAPKPLAPKPNCEPQQYIREFRLEAPATHTAGTVLTVADVFKDIKAVDVVGRTKGRGFAGVIKRHNYGGLRHTHGVKKGWRQRGSIASNASNRGSGRPKKGIRMAGHYGDERVTARNLKVVKIDADGLVGWGEAEIMRSKLESEGIPCVLQREAAGAVFVVTFGPLAEVRVLVPEPLVDRAINLLDEGIDVAPFELQAVRLFVRGLGLPPKTTRIEFAPRQRCEVVFRILVAP